MGLPLTGTATAPAASGLANLGPGWVSLELNRLVPGVYQVQAVLKPGHQRFILAWVAVVDPEWQPSIEAGNSRSPRDSTHQATVLKTQVQIGLPSQIPTENIESIAVADTAGCPWLVSDVGKNSGPASARGALGYQP